MDQHPIDTNNMKTHEEINTLFDELRFVENNFKDLDFLKDLPEEQRFETTEKDQLAEYIDEIPQPETQPELPTKIEQQTVIQQKNPFKEFKPIKKISYQFQDKLFSPILQTPDVGNTTFTLQINKGNLIGFHKPVETKELKELIPLIKQSIPKATTSIKNTLKQIKENGIKNELKSIPTKIKTPLKKLNIETIKKIPTKLRNMLSSD